MIREPVQPDKRKMTPARRARLLAKLGAVCRFPECSVSTGLELDHIVALDLGGRDADDNFQVLCGPHHAAKTKLDAKLIAKGRRIRKRENGTRRERRPIPQHVNGLQSRGFDKRLRKRMSGKVERISE
jgi:5-methylcytosine-specific restriction endonuclease McrA